MNLEIDRNKQHSMDISIIVIVKKSFNDLFVYPCIPLLSLYPENIV